MMYTVKNRVEEFPEIEYNDGVKKLFLYTDGKNGGSDALKNLLKYIENSKEENAVDAELKKLHLNVERLKCNSQIGVKFMHLQVMFEDKVKAAVDEAVKEAVDVAVKETVEETEQRMSTLTKALLADQRHEDLLRMLEDKEYRKQVLAEYGL